MAERARLEIEVVKALRAPIPPSFLRGVLVRAISLPEVEARLPSGTATVALRLTTDDELHRLNRDYAGHDSATDVLSFGGSVAGRAQGQPHDHGAGAPKVEHVGDIAISWPTVVRQAREYGHPEETELGLLSIHGLLHLLGWDHVTAAQRKEMSRLTIAALALSGIRPAQGRL